MGLVSVLRNFAMLVWVGAIYALIVFPISILLIVIVRDAWKKGAAALAAAPTGELLLFLPTFAVLATLLATAPSVCPEPSCNPRHDVLRVAIGVALIAGAMLYVARRHPLRVTLEGRRLITAALVAQGYYALVACYTAYWSMQSSALSI